MSKTNTFEQKSETELRGLDLTSLASQSRQAWDQVKNQIPSEVRQQIEPHFNVLTDVGYIRSKAEEMAGQSK